MKIRTSYLSDVNYVYPCLEWKWNFINKNITIKNIYSKTNTKGYTEWIIKGFDHEIKDETIIKIKESSFKWENSKRSFELKDIEIGKTYHFAWKINTRVVDMENHWYLYNNEEVKFFIGYKKSKLIPFSFKD